jgi:hypothetical protein
VHEVIHLIPDLDDDAQLLFPISEDDANGEVPPSTPGEQPVCPVVLIRSTPHAGDLALPAGE